MDVRKVLHERPMVTAGACIVLVAIAGYFGYRGMNPTPKPHYASSQLFFTSDDGQTYQPFDPDNVAPFTDAGGKTWVRAYVFKCKDDKPFVGYLEMYPPAVRSRIMQAEGRIQRDYLMEEYRPMILVKKPKDPNWVRRLDAPQVTDITCPGTSEKAMEYLPQ